VIRAVVVDFGGVIALEPTAEAVERLSASCGFDSDGFVDRWYEHRLPYDRGELTATQYWRLTGVADEDLLEDVLAADADAWSRCDPVLVDWLPRVRASGLKTALLSNMPREQWAGLSPGFAWLSDLDQLTLSFELGVAKPEERIYRHCLAELGVEPEDAVFVDDRIENVAAARALGMHALQYTGVAALRAQLPDGVPMP
jgi:putative hydrolase of the HAD superfamily